MKLKEFKKRMKKPLFTWEEAKVAAFETPPSVLKFQLHYWRRQGEILSLKRGVYLFADQKVSESEIARTLYPPCYLSLEWGLKHYGLILEEVFAYTLVTTRTTRTFRTPQGRFVYHTIKPEGFLGYDAETLIAKPEKALVDYLYLNRHHLVPQYDFWEAMRWQNLKMISFRKARAFAKYFGSKKTADLLESLKTYAKSGAMD